MEKIRSYKTWLMGFSIAFLATATLVLVFYEVALAIIDGSVNDLFWLKTYIGTVVVIVLFALSFIIDRIPFLSEIPGVNEVFLGTAGLLFGIDFIDGVIIKLLFRFLNFISIILNSVVYSVISYFDKNKFVEV